MYINSFENDLIHFMVRIYLHNFLEIGSRIVTCTCKHLSFLNFIHERTMSVSIGDYNTGLICQSVWDNHIVNFIEEKFFGIFDEWFVFLRKEFLFFSLKFIIVWHFEISLSNIDNILLLILTKNVENVLVNWIIAENDFVAFADETDNQWWFFKYFSIFSTEIINLILDSLHFFNVIIERNEVSRASRRMPTSQRCEFVSVCFILKNTEFDCFAEFFVKFFISLFILFDNFLFCCFFLCLEFFFVH